MQIKTYQLQYKLPNGNFAQLMDDTMVGFPIEFLEESAARKIAEELAGVKNYPATRWRIVCSNGSKEDLF